MKLRNNATIAPVILLSFVSNGVSGAGLPSVPLERTRLGIVSMGTTNYSAERAYPLVEKRIQRWLENLDAVHASAETIFLKGRREWLRSETNERRVKQLSAELWKKAENLSDPNLSSGISQQVEELETLRRQLSVSGSGPVIQKAFVAEAAFYWASGKEAVATELLRRAISLSPQAKAELPSVTGEIEHSVLNSMEAKILDLESRWARGCLLNVSLTGGPAVVFGNGFEMGSHRQFRLPKGGTYHLRAETAGSQSNTVVVSCERPGIKSATLAMNALSPSHSADSLSQLSRSHAVESLCLVEPQGDRFRLYLYTPGVSVDEIPMQAPWKVADVLENPNTDAVPIATDAFLDLLSRHRNSRLALAESSPGPLPQRVTAGVTDESRWYNNWKFWAVASGVVGAAVITYLATRSSQVSSTQTGLHVTIH